MTVYQAARLIKEKKDYPACSFGLKSNLYPFQVQGVHYLYTFKKCLLADSTGLGKTVQCFGLFSALEKQKVKNNRWIIVVPANALYQWASEFKIFTDFVPVISDQEHSVRVSNYIMQDWQFLLISYNMFLRDWKFLDDCQIINWVFDDAHYFKHHNTKTAKIVKHVTRNADRIVLTTATPIQKTLLDMHSLFETLGLNQVFGTLPYFYSRYCLTQRKIFTLKNGRTVRKNDIIGHKNLEEFKQRAYPYYLKRNFSQVGEQLPSLRVQPLWLKLSCEQEAIYNQLKNDFIRIYDEGKSREVKNKGFHSILQSLAGTRTFGAKEDVSVKLDAVDFFVREKLGDEKVVIYSFYKETLRTLMERLIKQGIAKENIAVITGETSAYNKEQQKIKFTSDPNCKILLGSGAIEVAMNLQVARYLIMIDLILNPQRIMQLIGRIRRLGSKHNQVILYILLTKGTIEERLWEDLKFESAINDLVFNEKSEVFPALTDARLLGLLRS